MDLQINCHPSIRRLANLPAVRFGVPSFRLPGLSDHFNYIYNLTEVESRFEWKYMFMAICGAHANVVLKYQS